MTSARTSPPNPPAAPAATGVYTIPGVVRRNTILMAAAQACVGVGTQMVPTLGALMVVRLLGSATFAGLGTGMLGLSRFLVAYPIGMLSDRYGRKPGMVLGLCIALMGSLICASAMVLRSFPIFVVGQLSFGMGLGGLQQLRVAAADMYPPNRRAEGLGYLLTGSFVGAIGGPLIVSAASALGPELGLDSIAVAWLLVPAVLVPAIFLVLQVRPDPKYIASNLAEFYPGYISPPRQMDAAGNIQTGFRYFVRQYPLLTAFTTNFAVQGTMAMMMAMTAYTLDVHGHALPMISLSVALHVMGMFGLSLPLGKLSDRYGRRPLMMAGVIITAMGSLLIVATPVYWIITLGTVLVGLGWSSATVASTALIGDASHPLERGRAVGTSDTFAAAAGITMPLMGGPLVELLGLPAVGILGAVVSGIPLILLSRLAEPRIPKA